MRPSRASHTARTAVLAVSGCLGQLFGQRDSGEFLAGYDLDALAPVRLAQGKFVGLDALPTFPRGVGDATSFQALKHRFGSRVGGPAQGISGVFGIGDDVDYRLARIGLVYINDPH